MGTYSKLEALFKEYCPSASIYELFFDESVSFETGESRWNWNSTIHLWHEGPRTGSQAVVLCRNLSFIVMRLGLQALMLVF